MVKLGKLFELVVADVLREIDPSANVRTGEWVVGPDGRRELDVVLEGTVDGKPHRMVIECKDFNPNTTGRVGIGYVDALDSKRQDLGFDVSLICSNAGFTADAIRKATRVGIGLVSVMREGDQRIRHQLVEEIYVRHVRIESINIFLMADDPIPLLVPFNETTVHGLPVGNWVLGRALILIGTNPIVRGSHTVRNRMKRPTEFVTPSGAILATRLDFEIVLCGGWFAHQVALDAKSGLYDWLRRRFRMASGPGNLTLKDVNLEEGEPIDCPPDVESSWSIRTGEMCINLLMLYGHETRKPVPEIDDLVMEEDLDPKSSDPPSEMSASGDT